MLMFTLVISFDHFQFALIHGPNIPGSYVILLFIASDLASITTHIHKWVLFLLWVRLFIPSGVISPLKSSSILGNYWPGEFIFQCPIFLPFHTVHSHRTNQSDHMDHSLQSPFIPIAVTWRHWTFGFTLLRSLEFSGSWICPKSAFTDLDFPSIL